MADKHKSRHIKLTSHPGAGGAKPTPIHRGAPDPATRGPIIATPTNPDHRNVIGTHSGSHAVNRALAIAAKAKIRRLVSMSNIKYADARVEMDAKLAAGYFTADGKLPARDELAKPKGRGLAE